MTTATTGEGCAPVHGDRGATLTSSPRVVPSIAELRRAWSLVSSGELATAAVPSPPTPPTATHPVRPAGPAATFPGPDQPDLAAARQPWTPAEELVVVVGAHPQAGASTFSLAVSLADPPSRVIECAASPVSGLAGATTAELGVRGSWSRAQREGAVIERFTAAGADRPLPVDRMVRRTVLDLGTWDATHSRPPWCADTIAAAPCVVVVSLGTVPGLRRLELALDGLDASRCVVVIRASTGHRLPRPTRAAFGPHLTEVADSGRLVVVPCDPRLLVLGPSPAELPKSLLRSARSALDLVHPFLEGTH